MMTACVTRHAAGLLHSSLRQPLVALVCFAAMSFADRAAKAELSEVSIWRQRHYAHVNQAC